MTIEEIQKEIIDEFSFFEDWTQRYEYIIELGKSLPKINDDEKLEDNLISGCQSKVWITATSHEGKITFFADSDAILTKGIIALLLRVFNHQTPDSILNASTNFIDKIGLKEHLSPTRSNGLLAMVKKIKFYALVLKKVKPQN